MNFCFLSQRLELIEGQSSRLEITEKLGDLFGVATAEESKQLAYLVCAGLGPQYKNIVFGVAEKQMLLFLKSFFTEGFDQEFTAAAFGSGDLGEAFCLVRKTQLNQQDSCTEICHGKFQISLLETFGELEAIAAVTGTGSVLRREHKINSLLARLCPNACKYVIKIILGKLRLGFSEMTVLDGLSWMVKQDKSLKEALEDAFNVCADIGLIAYTLKSAGIDAIRAFDARPGIPIRPAAAERMESVDEITQKLGACVAQPKLDGLRLQVHKFVENTLPAVRFFSRNLLDVTHMFPELAQSILALPAQSLIAEGEAVAFDAHGSFLSFQETAKRRRKHEIATASSTNPVQLYLFDLLFLNGKPLLEQPHAARRALLSHLFLEQLQQSNFLRLIEEKEFFEADTLLRAAKLEEYFEQQLEQGLEGLVVKRPDAVYKAGKRNFNWVKLKRLAKTALEDTIDCVIMGYYFGRGKRAGFGIGALLAGVYNQATDSFETVCKIGTGLSDADLASYKVVCDQNQAGQKPVNFLVAKMLEPDVWVNPQIVICVRADQISKSPNHTAAKNILGQGLALRFPRLIARRQDKSATDATSAEELAKMSELQRLG